MKPSSQAAIAEAEEATNAALGSLLTAGAVLGLARKASPSDATLRLFKAAFNRVSQLTTPHSSQLIKLNHFPSLVSSFCSKALSALVLESGTRLGPTES